jgi:uncharacterized iron-regulated membrane protein
MNARLVVEIVAFALLLIVSGLVLWAARSREARGTPPRDGDEPRVLSVDLTNREPPP